MYEQQSRDFALESPLVVLERPHSGRRADAQVGGSHLPDTEKCLEQPEDVNNSDACLRLPPGLGDLLFPELLAPQLTSLEATLR